MFFFSGNVGKHLSSTPSVFLSIDAGINWKKVCITRHFIRTWQYVKCLIFILDKDQCYCFFLLVKKPKFITAVHPFCLRARARKIYYMEIYYISIFLMI